MRRAAVPLLITALLGGSGSVMALECPGHPDALGTERVLIVDPRQHTQIGTMQYHETFPLAEKEVILSFDDAPVRPYTNRVLDALAAQCVKATFFVVGGQARAFPDLVRRIYNEGHTVASHSQTHPLIFTRLSLGAAEQEIDQGIRSVTAALGDPNALAPFFRFPGLGRSRAIESYLAARGIMTWSADFVADDWTHISTQEVLRRALERLEQKGKGILLLHDIQPATALMLPELLRELKARGYHIVQVIPAGVDRPETVTEPESWVMHKPPKPPWPTVLEPKSAKLNVPSAESFGWPRPFRSQMIAPMPIPPAMIGGLPENLQSPRRLPAWSPPASPTDADLWMQPTSPILTFGMVSQFDQLSLSTGIYDPARSVIASDETFSSMVVPSRWTAQAKKPSPASSMKPQPRPGSRPVGNVAPVHQPIWSHT